MRFAVRFLALGALLLVGLAGPAAAQYMYLDANRDGVWDATDQLNPDTTTVLLWLDTNHDKDASARICNDHTGAPVASFPLLSSTTLGSTTVTSCDPARFALVGPGLNAVGTGIPASTTVVTKNSGCSLTLLNSATATGSPNVTYSKGIVCNTTVGSAIVTSAALFGPVVIGQAVSGTGIPTGTTVAAKADDSNITLSANASATSAVSRTFSAGSIKTDLVSGSSSALAGLFGGLLLGMPVTGTGIASGTLMTARTNEAIITISQPATATGTNTLTFKSPMDLFSYDIIVHADGGEVTYETWNPGAGFSSTGTDAADATDLNVHYGRALGDNLRGLQLLGWVKLTISSGNPSLGIADSSPLDVSGLGTIFGTSCDASDFPNTYAHNRDWFDVDGPAAPPGGNATPAIDAPATVDGTEGSSVFTPPLEATATDADAGDNLTITSAGAPASLTFEQIGGPGPSPSTAHWTGTLAFNEAGVYPIDWTVSDGVNTDVTTSTTLTVANTNRAPTLSQPSDMTVNEGGSQDQLVTAADPDGDVLNIVKLSGPAFFTIVGVDATHSNIHLTPNFTAAGVTTGTVRVSDPGSLHDDKTFGITVIDVNQAPTLTQPADLTVTENATGDRGLTGSDPDANPLTFSKVSGPTFATVTTLTATTGNVHVTLTGNVTASTGSPYATVVRASDGTLNDDKTFDIIVLDSGNQAPTLNQPADLTVAENATGDRALSGTDPDSDPLTFSKVSGPTFATVTTLTATTGNVHVTLTGNFSAATGSPYATTVRASDGTLNNDKTFNIVVLDSGNQAPTLTQPADMTVAENATGDQGLTGSDPDGNSLTFSKVSGPAFATVTTLTATTGNVHVDLTGNFSASTGSPYATTVRASDGSLNSDKTFNIVVTNANGAPTLTQPADMTVAENTTGDQGLTGSDPDGDALTFSKVSGPTFATVTTLTATTGNVHVDLTGDLTASTGSPYATTVRASDGALNSDKTFNIVVPEAGNQAPLLTQPADMTVAENATGDQGLTASDPDGNSLTFSKVSGPAFAAVTTLTATTGNVHVDLTGNFSASTGSPYPATVRASDGALNSDKTFNIVVTNTDRAPSVTAPVSAIVAEGSTLAFTVTAADPDADPIADLSAAPLPSGATFTPDDPSNTSGSFSWTPTSGQAGNYSIDFTATNALSGSATTAITVVPGGNGTTGEVVWTPGASDAGQTYTVDFTATDGDGEIGFASTTVVVEGGGSSALPARSASAGGQATSPPLVFAPGSVNAAVGQILVIPVFASDPDGTPVTLTANTTQLAGATFTTNASPTVTAPASESVDEGDNLSFGVTASDPDADHVTLTAPSKPVGSNFVDNGDNTGTFNWTPNFTQSGPHSVTFHGDDGNGGTDDANTEITVNNKNRAPIADPGGPYAGIIGVPVSFDGNGTSDPDGNSLSYAWDFDALDGITVDATGPNVSHTYGAPGVFTVTLTVKDDAAPNPGSPVLSDTKTTTANIASQFEARCFTTGGNKAIRLGSGKPRWCVQIEPVGGNFSLNNVDLASIVMKYGTGQIAAETGKTLTDGDRDGNGVTEITACFTKGTLRTLFAGLGNGKNTVTVAIEGDLTTGGKFHGEVTLDVIATGAIARAKASPNPLNPETTISFELSKPGSVRLQIFDISGRLVNTLADEVMSGGYHDVRWNGTTTSGTKVASGMYFFVLSTLDETTKGQLVVLK